MFRGQMESPAVSLSHKEPKCGTFVGPRGQSMCKHPRVPDIPQIHSIREYVAKLDDGGARLVISALRRLRQEDPKFQASPELPSKILHCLKNQSILCMLPWSQNVIIVKFRSVMKKLIWGSLVGRRYCACAHTTNDVCMCMCFTLYLTRKSPALC